MPTFSSVLADRVRRTPGDPLITFYDHASGERVELSAVTYDNWVSKAAGLLTEEHDLERGMRLCIDLPTHWLSPVFLGAAWTIGLVVTSVIVLGVLGVTVHRVERRRRAGADPDTHYGPPDQTSRS